MFSWPLVGVAGVCWALAMAADIMPGSTGDVPERVMLVFESIQCY